MAYTIKEIYEELEDSKDELIYWVLTSEELKNTGKLGS